MRGSSEEGRTIRRRSKIDFQTGDTGIQDLAIYTVLECKTYKRKSNRKVLKAEWQPETFLSEVPFIVQVQVSPR